MNELDNSKEDDSRFGASHIKSSKNIAPPHRNFSDLRNTRKMPGAFAPGIRSVVIRAMP
ncbi:hypothetical protein [Burkholderia oklahomensis]|uniref:hypothetical protein n=1 Tax=Burkholderia oklahomensis TaxID=342113 RepID=UPI0012F4CE3E|nr:hypothetical protein [Burkholderia oklahomensis]